MTKRTGAVSPIAREIARIEPVTIPVRAEGNTMRSDTLWGLAPSASPASRRVLGTFKTAISVESTITGSISTASANDPAIAENPTCRSWRTKEKANNPMRIDGAPAMV